MADSTYVPTSAGFLYLAVVVEVYSQRVVGGRLGAELATRLMLGALDMALDQRSARGIIHYSHRGSQYTSIAVGPSADKGSDAAMAVPDVRVPTPCGTQF